MLTDREPKRKERTPLPDPLPFGRGEGESLAGGLANRGSGEGIASWKWEVAKRSVTVARALLAGLSKGQLNQAAVEALGRAPGREV